VSVLARPQSAQEGDVEIAMEEHAECGTLVRKGAVALAGAEGVLGQPTGEAPGLVQVGAQHGLRDQKVEDGAGVR